MGKPIDADYQKKYKERNKEKLREQGKEYKDKHRDEIKLKAQEYYRKNKDAILAKKIDKWRNDPDYRKRQVKWAEKYKQTDKGREVRKNINRNSKHKRKAREKELEASLTVKQWDAIKGHFDFKCAYCGCETDLTRDHFVPLVNGGEFSINNIIPVCIRCNDSKGSKNFFEWYPQQEFYSPLREKRILKFLGYSKNGVQQLQMGLFN